MSAPFCKVMKEILLTQGKIALVDDDDFEEVSKYKWYAKYTSIKHCYAVTKVKSKYSEDKYCDLYMHHLIFGKPRKGMVVDHKNKNSLDNQKVNLRFATKSQNGMNRGKSSINTSGYKGVFWHKRSKRWYSQIRVNGGLIRLGQSDSRELMAEKYKEACKKYHGDFYSV